MGGVGEIDAGDEYVTSRMKGSASTIDSMGRVTSEFRGDNLWDERFARLKEPRPSAR